MSQQLRLHLHLHQSGCTCIRNLYKFPLRRSIPFLHAGEAVTAAYFWVRGCSEPRRAIDAARQDVTKRYTLLEYVD